MQLDFEKTKKLFERYKLPLARSILIKKPEQLIKLTKKIGFPLVLKISSVDIIHKSDINGVKIGIENKEELIKAYNEIINNMKKRRVKIEGVLMQKMEEGKEIIIGVKRDIQFGPVLLFGLGGVFVEALRDISIRIAPVDKKEALNMIKEIKGYKILEGIRGEKAVNIDALASIITKISNMVLKNKKIIELDLNPIIVNDKKATIVDARIIVES
ncbi:acetate--CoA ligase family protein [Candidatus Woesearchaeota archaeon]|nr:acetate--CoA ligase family protein [Candidatus Woesearchaeota archaeon]